MKKLHYLPIALLFVINGLSAQNIEYAREIISTLASPNYHGRGYTHKGEHKAAQYIALQMKEIGLKSYGKDYFQYFPINVNTIRSVSVSVDGKVLEGGKEFLPDFWSGTTKGKFSLEFLTPEIFLDSAKLNEFLSKSLKNKFLVIELPDNADANTKDLYFNIIYTNPINAAGFVSIQKTGLIGSPSTICLPYSHFNIREGALSTSAKTIEVKLKSKYIKGYETQNVIGYIEGEKKEAIVLTAHYDHIGRIDKNIYFPGAHDNASGIATMLDMAKYYTQAGKKPKYTMIFIAFGAEETGLNGSKYFTENPLLPLKSIKFLLNMDLFGSGDEGIQVINGTVHKSEFDRLTQINNEKKYLKEIKIRGTAANSDHYYFHTKGVMAFYIYTLGTYKEYHNIFDTAQSVPLPEYDDIFRLIVDFFDGF